MDNFEFNLQLFATVSLENAKEATATTYIKADGTLTESAEGAVAQLTVENGAKTLTVAVGTEESKSAILTDATMAELAGIKVETKTTLSAEETATATIKLGEDGTEISAKVLKISSKGIVVDDGDKVTVSNAGVITLATASASATIAVYGSATDTQPTSYAISALADTKASVTVSGDYVGVYKDVTLNGATIELSSTGAATVKHLAGEPAAATAVTVATLKDDAKLELTASDSMSADTEVKYYALTVDSTSGQLTIGEGKAASVAVTGAKAFFKVTYKADYGQEPSATVELVGVTAENKPGTASSVLLSGVKVDATALKTIPANGGAAVTNITVASGVVSGAVTMTGVTSTADVSIAGKDYKDDHATAADDANIVTYTPSYEVSTATGAVTLDLSSMKDLTADGNKIFVINATKDSTAGHGKMLYTVSATDTEPSGTSHAGYFKVAYVQDTSTYTLTFVAAAGEGMVPTDLTAIGWENIVVNATGLASGKKLVITPTKAGEGDADTSHDNYKVTGAAVGLKVTKATVTNDSSKLTVVRATTSTEAKLVIKSDADTVITGIPLADASQSEEKSTYWVVGEPNYEADHDGKPTITISKSNTQPTSGSYLTVTSDGKNCTVTYTNGANIALSGFTGSDGKTIANGSTTAAQVVLDPANLQAGGTLTLTDETGKVVDYKVTGLKPGVTIAGNGTGDTVAYDTSKIVYSNDISLKLSDISATTYYKVNKAAAPSTTTGLTSLTLGGAYAATELTGGVPAETATYIAVTVTTNSETGVKTYKVDYHKGESGPDLVDVTDGTSINGGITIDATGLDNKVTVTLDTKSGTDVVTEAYTVTNVKNGTTGPTIGQDEGTANITYVGGEYAFSAGENKISLATGDIGKKYVLSATTAKGITTYELATGVASNAEISNASYFTTVYDSETKTVSVVFKEGSAEGAVKLADFVKNTKNDKTAVIPVSGTDINTEATTVTLTTDDETGDVKYAVTDLPKTVTTLNAGTNDDVSNAYTATYEFAKDGNVITLGSTAGTVYYEVTSTGGQSALGVYTCTIGSALTPTGADDAAKLASIAGKNYFAVTTGEDGNVSITYHKATGEKVTSLALDGGLEVAVDPTSASSTAIINCGAASGDDGKFTYNVTGLVKGQTAKTPTGADDTVKVKYNVSYEFADDSATIELNKTDAEARNTVYYTVERSDGATEGNDATTQQGVVKFKLTKLNAGETPSSTAKAYFMVKYSSDYQVNVTYVNPTGEKYDLNVAGVPQVTVNANDLAGGKIDTINVADTTGGDYNKVNYALTNVPAGVSVIDTNNENNALGDGDTVSYKNIAVLADKSVINLGTAAETYYVVTAGTTNNGVTTCTVAADGTKDKPADTANYFVAAKDSDGNYKITYHMANGTGYAFNDPAKNSLTINAAGMVVSTAKDGSGVTTAKDVTITTSDVTGVTKTITNAAGNVTAVNDTNNKTTISYNTTFAWAPGTYYIPVADAMTAAAGVTSGATVAGNSEKQYVQVKVSTTTDDDGNVTYSTTVDEKVYTATTANTGVMAASDSVSADVTKLTLTLDEGIKSFDADSKQYKAITGVTAGDTLTNVYSATEITTAALDSGKAVKLNDTNGTIELTSAGGSLTFTGAGKVKAGSVLLTKAEAAVSESAGTSADGIAKVELVQAASTNGGVTVTFDKGEISSITGLDDGDQVNVYNNSSSTPVAHYRYKTVNGKNYIIKVANNNTTYATAEGGSAANLVTMDFAASTTVKVGTFAPKTADTYYVDAGTVASGSVTLTESATATDAQNGHYYAKVKINDANGTIESISVVKGNSLNLVDAATDYTGTITVPAGLFTNGKVTYTGTTNTGYKVAFTGVGAGSTFTNLDSDDTIVTGELNASDKITIDSVEYKAVGTEKQTFKFSGNKMTQGTVTFADQTTNHVLIAADGTKIAYASTEDTASGVTLVFGEEGVTSITGLTNGETLTLTNTNGKVTTYTTTSADGSSVTRTVTKDGQTVTDTLTVPLDDSSKQTNILAVESGSGAKLNSHFAWANSTTATIGYFKVDTEAAAGSRTFTVAAQDADTPITLSDETVVIKAVSEFANGKDAGDGIKLTLTPMVSDAKGNLSDDISLFGDTVKITGTADTTGTKFVFDENTTYKVAFTNVAAGSSLNINQTGSTVETVDLADGASITVNGKTIKDMAGRGGTGTTKLYIASSSDVRVVNGTVAVTDELKGESNANALVDTVTYTKGTDNTDGVVVTYTNGKASAITGLQIGETVTVTTGSKVTTYTAALADPANKDSKTVIWRTVSGSADATENVTKVQSITNNADVVGGSYADVVEVKSDNGFSTQYNSTTPAVNTGYFLVDAEGNLTIADVTKGTTIATYQNAGTTLVKAVIANDGTLTLTKERVSITGAAETGTAWAAKDVKLATIKVTGSQLIKYTKAMGVDNVAITGIGANSEISGLATGDTVETASLNEGQKVTLNGSIVYTAGGTGKLVFDGTAVKSGIFKTTGSLTATNTNDSTKVKTESVIAYTAGTSSAADNETDGVNVTISDGKVTSITDLWVGEKVAYTETVTAKDGSQTVTKTTYTAADATVASGAQKGYVVVTKAVEKNGNVTTYTQTFSSATMDVTKSDGWSVSAASTTSKFQFGDTSDATYTTTGYFAATAYTSDKTDVNYGKYKAEVKAQTSDVTLAGSSDATGYPKYYLKVTATKGVAGNVTFTEMGLVALKANGAIEPVTDKELYAVDVTAPANADIELADHDFAVAITASGTGSKFSNLNDDDTVTTASDFAANSYITVNSKKYTAAEAGAISVKGDTIVSGKVKVEGTALTANADGAKIEYTAKEGATAGQAGNDGVIVAFTADGGIASIKDLDAGEKVTVTAKDGTVTTYERDDSIPSAPKFTKTVTTKDGQKTEWTYTNNSAIDDTTTTGKDIIGIEYGVSTKFSWPDDGKTAVAYAKVATATATATIPASDTTVPIGTNDQVVRMEVSRDGSTYTIKSLKLLQGTTLTDVTGVERDPDTNSTETAKVAVSITVPAVEGATLAFDGAVSLPAAKVEGHVVDRHVALNITGAKKGQVYTGLADVDTVTTSNLAADAEITVGTVKFAAAEAGAITVKGDGTAYNGGFKLAKGYVVKGLKNDSSGTKVEVSMDSDDAMVTVVGGQVQSIYKLNAGETVTVTETDKNNVVSTVTYKGSTGEGDKITVTRTTVTDGVTTIEKATITDGGDILSSGVDYKVDGSDNGVTSHFDWKLTSGSGYFQLTDADGKLTADTLSVATQPSKGVKIDSKNAGEIYAKVSLSADNTLSGISLYKVKTDGTLEAITALAGEQKVNVVITAPAAKLTADLVANTANITANTIQIVDAAAESVITLRKGDSLTTASLTADSKTISVDGTSYQAGGNTILKFVKDADTTGAKAVLTDGIVKLTNGQNFNAAGAKSAEASDNISVNFAEVNTGDSAVITVVNGVVTNISGTGKVTVGDDVYTYNAATKVYDLNVTTATGETFTTAKLAKGAVITIGGATYKSGAADNSVTFKNEGGTNKLYSGVVTIPAQGSSLTITDGDTVTTGDDVTVTYTTAATTNSGAPTVKVVNGTIQSITGLNDGETLTVVDNSVDKIEKTTTYTATATGVTRVVKKVDSTGTESVTTTVTDNATLLAGGDLLTASYYNGTNGDTGTKLVGQFNWSTDIAGRSIGYFAATVNNNDVFVKTETVNDQTKEVVISAPNKGTKTYLVASAQSDGQETPSSVLTLGNLLTIDATGKVTTNKLNESTLPVTGVIPIKAPADKITFIKPATNLKVNLTNLAADSTVSGLIKGDTVETATLAAGDTVEVGGKTYTTAIKGVLKFIGEGAVTANEGTVTVSTTDGSGAALLSGTVNLYASGSTEGANSAILAGNSVNSDTGKGDDITVTNNSTTDNVVVRVTNGVVSSITGLKTQGDTVTVTNASGKIGSGSNASEYSGATIVYKALGNNMYSRTIFKDGTNTGNVADTYDDGDTLINAGFLTTSKSGGEIYTGTYKPAAYNKIGSYFTADNKPYTVFYKPEAQNSPANSDTMVTASTVDASKLSVDKTQFTADQGDNYLGVTAVTKADGVTTIKSVDVYTAGATGALTQNTKQVYKGTLTLDGTLSTSADALYDAKYAVINYTLTKNGTFDVVANNVSYKSKFTNLGEGDKITTAAIADTALSSGTYYIYHGEDETADKKAYTETRTITVKSGKNDSVVVSTSATDGTITKLTGLATKKEQVTVTELTAKGLTTTVYAVTGDGVVTRTITAADGTKSIATTTATVTGDTDFAKLTNAADWTSTTSNTIAANFDWTLQNNTTGYFLVGNNAATATTKKNISIKSGNASSYIAVKVSDNGVVDSVEQVSYDSETGTMQATEAAFAGKLTMVAPTAYEFNFNRTTAMQGNVSEATLIIKDIIAGSEVTGLVNNDTVTTKKLTKETSVSVNGEKYTVSSSGGALGFKVQDVSIDGEDYAGKVTLTSGTVSMGYSIDDDNVAGQGFVYVGSSNLIEAKKDSYITVTANANGTFSIGGLDENESFKVNGYTYMKSGTNLVRTYNDAAGAAVTEIYDIKGAKTVSSKALNNGNNWKYTAETLTADETGAMSSSYGIVTANLALADNRFAADKKADKVTTGTYPKTYDYVLDKYVSSKTNPSATKQLNGYVVSSDDDWQTEIGTVVMNQIFNDITNTTTTTYTYRASSAVGQAIKVAANWWVEGSDNADTINGATKGTDFIRAGKGDDKITLSGASDTVAFNLAADGQNTVIGYTTGKDAIVLDTVDSTDDSVEVGTVSNDYDGNFSVYLDKTGSGNVYLYADTNGDGFTADDSYVMLQGVGKTGKAVTINDKHFYFGNGNSKKGATFAYEDGAYYVGNTSKLNSLQVTTDKTKATRNTLGDDVTIDLMAVDGEGHSYYTNINTIDASKSANSVVLSGSTESGANITLKGGTYQSTLKSGASNDTMQGNNSGKDMFWFDDLSGSDTIKSYASGKDYVYIGGNEDLKEAGYTITSSGNDVIISSGDNQVKIVGAAAIKPKAISISKDGKIDGKSVSYFVGKSGNNVSNNFTYAEGAYYIGNSETKDATATKLDTLTVKETLTAAPTAVLKIDMNDNKYQSIEAVDASTRTVNTRKVNDTSKAGVNVIANNDNGTRFKGTAYADSFTCGDGKDYIIYNTKQKDTDTISGLGIGDVIQLNNLSPNEIATVQSKLNSIASTGEGTISFNGGGTLKFSGITAGTMNLTLNKKGTVYTVTATAKA